MGLGESLWGSVLRSPVPSKAVVVVVIIIIAVLVADVITVAMDLCLKSKTYPNRGMDIRVGFVR